MDATRRRINQFAVGALAGLAAPLALAQRESRYPTRPIHLITGYPAGGPSDISARAVAQRLGESLGQPVVVENHPGASGNIGAQLVAQAVPDGYTLLNGVSAMTIAPAFSTNLSYDVLKDFAPISLTALSAFVLCVHPSVPAQNVGELISYAKANPGKVTYASSGVGGPPHLAGELFKSMAHVDILHVPYKGVGQSISDLIAGNVAMMFTSPPNAIPHVRANKIRALGVSTMTRSKLLPDVPTISEQGLKGFEMGTWFGLMAPAGTPVDIVNRLNSAMKVLVADQGFRDQMLKEGFEPKSSSPREFHDFMAAEVNKFSELVRTAHIQAS